MLHFKGNIHDNTQIMFDGKYAHDVENQQAQQYILGCSNLGPNDTTIDWANKSFPGKAVFLKLNNVFRKLRKVSQTLSKIS